MAALAPLGPGQPVVRRQVIQYVTRTVWARYGVGVSKPTPAIAVSDPSTAMSANSAYLLHRLGADATRLLAVELQPLGLRPRHFAAFHTLASEGGCSQRTLGAALGMDPNSVVVVIDDLQQRGLVERRRDPNDRRRYALYLTDAGRDMLEQVRAAAATVEQAMLAPLDPAQREAIRGMLTTIAGIAAPAAAAAAGPPIC